MTVTFLGANLTTSRPLCASRTLIACASFRYRSRTPSQWRREQLGPRPRWDRTLHDAYSSRSSRGVQITGGSEAVRTTYGFDFWTHRSVGNVCTVPRDETVHTVRRSERDMKRVGRRLGGEGGLVHERPAQSNRIRRELEQRHVAQRFEALRRRNSVTRGGLIQNELRDVQLEGAARCPPLSVVAWFPARTRSRLGRAIR